MLGGGTGKGLVPNLGLPAALPGSPGEDPCDPLSPGSLNLYHPPVYVNATSWCSKWVGSLSSTGVCIQPTTHLSSSAIPLDCDRIEVDDKAIWDCCDGMLYVAYDHSELNILNGSGKNGVRGESLDCRFLEEASVQAVAIARNGKRHTKRQIQIPKRTRERSPYHSTRRAPVRLV